MLQSYPISKSQISTTHLSDLFYQCQFQKVIEQAHTHWESLDKTQQFQAQILISKSYFEMHMMEQFELSKKNIIQADNKILQNDYLYYLGSMEYFNDQHQKSLEYFQQLKKQAQTDQEKILALLGLGNVFYSEGIYPQVEDVLKELDLLATSATDPQLISILILKANFQLYSKCHLDNAKHLLTQALQVAIKNNWIYFITKALYGLCCVDLKLNCIEALKARLEILKSYLACNESHYLSYLVAEKFKDFSFALNPKAFEFNDEEMQIQINDLEIQLHKMPKMYHLFKYLAQGRFVSKKELALCIWGVKEYKARLHDPRIFDMIKRARQMVEKNPKQPTLILSSPNGYRLNSISHGETYAIH